MHTNTYDLNKPYQVTYGNGLVATYGHDASGRIKTYSLVGATSGNLLSQDYAWDRAGRLRANKRQQQPSWSATYDLDAEGQLELYPFLWTKI